MDILNKRTMKLLFCVRKAVSFWSKAKGLMLSPAHPLLMCFKKPRRSSLHTWFVFFNLQIYYLDCSGKVVEKTSMTPFSYYVPQKAACFVLEVPQAENFPAMCGDVLVFVSSSFEH